MRAQRTLVLAILFLTTFAVGLVPAQAAPAGTEACAGQVQTLAAPAVPPPQAAAPAQLPASVEALFTNVQPATAASPGSCARFCLVAFCPGTKCGALPGGGCGCL